MIEKEVYSVDDDGIPSSVRQMFREQLDLERISASFIVMGWGWILASGLGIMVGSVFNPEMPGEFWIVGMALALLGLYGWTEQRRCEKEEKRVNFQMAEAGWKIYSVTSYDRHLKHCSEKDLEIAKMLHFDK